MNANVLNPKTAGEVLATMGSSSMVDIIATPG